jgi:glutamyl-Q tRNA(Asp) synthetase
LLQELLGLRVPVWHHHVLLVEESGRKLAKRRGSGQGGLGLAEMRRSGADGLALAEDLRAGRLPTGISLGRGLGIRA